MAETIENPAQEIVRLQRRLERERRTRLEAENVAEAAIRAVYEKQREVDFLARIAGSANAAGSVGEAAQELLDAVCGFGPFDCGIALIPSDSAQGMALSMVCHDAVLGRLQEFLHKIRWNFESQPGAVTDILAVVDEVGFYEHFDKVPEALGPKEAAANGLSGVCLIPVIGGEGSAA